MEEFVKFVVNNGVSVGILGFLLWKVAPALNLFLGRFEVIMTNFRAELAADRDKLITRMDRLEEMGDSLAKENLLRLIASPHVADGLKDAATSVLRDVQNRTDEPSSPPANPSQK